MNGTKKEKLLQNINTASFALILITGIWIIVRQLLVREPVSSLNAGIIEWLLCLTAFCAWKGRVFFLFLPVAAGGMVLTVCTCFLGVTPVDKCYLLQTAASVTALVSGAGISLTKRTLPDLHHVPKSAAAAVIFLAASSLAVWGINTFLAKQSDSAPSRNIWAVPSLYDAEPESQAGTLQTITYQTKAYATDLRAVTKQARVYLPCGYDPAAPYNILYLMHGTGDDESYWLDKNPHNKWMVDHMIARGEIEPLIIVAPTFYVEDDCTDNLDQLTYSFAEELRNDLMPAVESAYSTYAESCDDDGFTASRDHRAFAGLSRGAVTTIHSALCGSLDYFSWFGAFSGSRTDGTYLRETIQTETLAQYPIHRFYATSGSFDFALSGQLRDYRSMIQAEPRLEDGGNAAFDVYPMRYHSTGAWHLALYNFLPLIFTETSPPSFHLFR